MKWITAFMLLCSVSCRQAGRQQAAGEDLTKYVNPYIGSEGHGHVFVGANVPHGAVQLGPVNIMRSWDKFGGWDWCSGYNYTSREILGFTHTHLSGTGIGDLNDILVLPATGKVQLRPMKFDDEQSGYGSFFSHSNETANAGYYSVQLKKYGVNAELTASERVGFHQYRFNDTANAHLLIDLEYNMGWDAPVETAIRKIDDTTLLGYRFSKGWAPDQRLYFAVRLSVPVSKTELYDSTALQEGSVVKGRGAKAALFFDAAKNPVLKVKVGLSPVSSEHALVNIGAEIPSWDFDQARSAAGAQWNKALQKITCDANDSVKTVLYTALYHSLFFPSVFNDHNGDYTGVDGKVYANPGFTNYTLFSLWDTYRALHPLMTIVEPERVNDYIKTFLAIYKQQGKLPVWHLNGNETNTMIGYPAIPVIVDAYLKGFRDYDVSLAYEAIRHSAMQDADGIRFIKRLEFIPADSVAESAAKGLEYAISDYAVAQMAKALGKEDDDTYFTKRSKLYAAYFDTATQFMRGRFASGKWTEPFDPETAPHRKNDYCEGNAWQYIWLVPQDVDGLIKSFGGRKPFIQKLDALFATKANQQKLETPDISGMIGQYAQGNEPNHHIPYLYSCAGQPWKTASLIRQIADSFYTTGPGGLCGNEDAGQMSAWYIFSALGFYPVNPVGGVYVFGTPLVNDARIRAGSKTFHVKVVNNSKENMYIIKAELNGNAYTKPYLLHSDVVSGGELVLHMGNKPSGWGVTPEQDN